MSSPSSSSRVTPNRPVSNLRIQIENDNDDDNHIDLLMRHSSPIDRLNHPNGNPSPISVRNSSPSLMGLSRPRSNPRNRTPMRYESPLPTPTYIPEEEEVQEGHAATTEGRRITILPMAGSARGTSIANFRNRQEGSNQQAAVPTKSRKQGPSHRKVRRWNNDNFVNLAKEVGGSNKAAEALLRGLAHAGQYHSVLSQEQSKNSIMTKLSDSSTKSEELRYVRDKFYEGELHSSQPKAMVNHKNHKKPSHLLTRDDKMNRIDKRLRQVVTRAIENSLPATKIMETLEDFLIRAHVSNEDPTTIALQDKQIWNGILSKPPIISRHGGDEDSDSDNKQILVLRFSFDSESSSNGGFHRLLLHALVQFHGLAVHSATTPTGGRLLTATGYLADTNHKLVDSVMQRREERLQRENRNSQLDVQTNRLNALTV